MTSVNWNMTGESSLKSAKTIRSVNLYGVVSAVALQRFGYYGIRSLLIVYLTTKLGIPDQLAGQVYGIFYGSLFLTSLLGGLLGDTTLGYRLTGSLGLILIFVSHLCLAFGKTSGVIIALILYSIGFGLFDPNVNAALAGQFHTDKRLRDAAYTILYSGINVGAMLGSLVCGYIYLHINWKYSFLTGGLFSLIGLISFRMAIKNQSPNKANSYTRLGSASIPEEFNEKVDRVSLAGRGATIIGMIGLLAITFWAVFDQLGSSITLLVQRHVNRNLGSFEVPAGYVQAINPFLVVLLGPVLSFVLKKKRPSAKRLIDAEILLFGLTLLGTGFGLLALGSSGVGTMGTQTTVGWSWVFLAVLFATVGELLFAPAATSLIAGLSPEKRRAFIMGAWSATFGVGAYLSGTMSGVMSTFAHLSEFFAISAGACLFISLTFLIAVHVMRSRRTDNLE